MISYINIPQFNNIISKINSYAPQIILTYEYMVGFV